MAAEEVKTLTRKRPLAALLAAACVLFSGAFWPDAPRGAWWCTAFSIAGSETVARQEDGDDGALEFRWGVVDWLRALLG